MNNEQLIINAWWSKLFRTPNYSLLIVHYSLFIISNADVKNFEANNALWNLHFNNVAHLFAE